MPCLHKTQRGDRRNRLGHGLDPHDRVLAHSTAADRRHARRDQLDAPSTHQRDPARNRAGVNVTNQQVLQRCAHLGDRATLDRRGSSHHPRRRNHRDLLLRRHFRSMALRCRMWPDVPTGYTGRGCMWPDVALYLRSLASRYAPRDLVSNANVRIRSPITATGSRVPSPASPS